MKTIVFQATEGELERLENKLFHYEREMSVEIRVYVMPLLLEYDEKDLISCSNEEFINLAEEEGRVYSLEGFNKAFNFNEVTPNVDYIRFINVPIY